MKRSTCGLMFCRFTPAQGGNDQSERSAAAEPDVLPLHACADVKINQNGRQQWSLMVCRFTPARAMPHQPELGCMHVFARDTRGRAFACGLVQMQHSMHEEGTLSTLEAAGVSYRM
jgi:hypothetical protein